jgi:hypothetical protein
MNTNDATEQVRPDQPHPEHVRPHEFAIIVNGRERTVMGDIATFEEVTKLAFPTPNNEANVVYTVTYRNAAQHPTSGELTAGGSVKVKNGTIFNVTRTVKS